MAIVALTLIWGISRLRFWLWLAEGWGIWAALAAALAEIAAIRAFFLLGPAILGAPATVLGLLALATWARC
jgi:hypothetical protein